MRRALLVVLVASTAHAGPVPECVSVSITPTDQLQIVAWVEKADGTFVDTIYITQKTGTYGLGNRPGRFDFNSGPVVQDLWPYGRRITVFPVWAHRHGMTWPEVDFQTVDMDGNHICCGDENNLSHPFNLSSIEHDPPYCQPLMPATDPWDAGSCATTAFTDKGIFSATALSLYPPRADIARTPSNDSASVDMYKLLNPFDAISQPTPAGGMPTQITWPVPDALPGGNYVMWLEVSKSFDYNDTYNQTSYPPPSVPFSGYGQPYRGQPSVVYSVPFTIGTSESDTSTQSYLGYGDADGATGTLHAPDATITTDTPGSGGSRLQIIAGSSGDRIQLHASPSYNHTPPAPPSDVTAAPLTPTSATISLVAAGGDAGAGTAAGYEIRYRTGDPITADNFADSMPATVPLVPAAKGTAQTFELDGLLPTTTYSIGIRAFDGCHNTSDLAVVQLTMPDRTSGEVDACFVATAAYGTVMANDVEMLRRYRDVFLKSTALGELAVETYYTFSPPVAGVVGESELLRATARAVLAPIVATVRHGRFE
jgi:hypothetical protein